MKDWITDKPDITRGGAAYKKLPEWLQYSSGGSDRKPSVDIPTSVFLSYINPIGSSGMYAAANSPKGAKTSDLIKFELASALGIPLAYMTAGAGMGLSAGLKKGKPLRGLGKGLGLTTLTADPVATSLTSQMFNDKYKDKKLAPMFPYAKKRLTSGTSVAASSLFPYIGPSKSGLKLYNHLRAKGFGEDTAMRASKDANKPSSNLAKVLGYGSLVPFYLANKRRNFKLFNKLRAYSDTSIQATMMGMAGSGLGSMGAVGRAEDKAKEIRKEKLFPINKIKGILGI